MIGFVSLFAVLGALSLIVAWSLSWPLLCAWRLAARRLGHRWSLVILHLPLVVGLAAALGAVWPSHSLALAWDSCHCDPAASIVHLCLAHPGGATPLLPLAIFTLVWLGWRPARSIVTAVRRLGAARALMAARPLSTDPATGILLGDLGDDNAYTVGLLWPRVIADRAWWASLDCEERAIVAAHERAHVRCADPLSHTVALVLAGLAPARLSRSLVEGWLGWTERRADLNAAHAVGDSARVAAFLVAQRRRDLPLSLVPAFGGSKLEQRVEWLLRGSDRPPRLRSDLPATLTFASGALATMLLLLGFQIHAIVERAFHLLN